MGRRDECVSMAMLGAQTQCFLCPEDRFFFFAAVYIPDDATSTQPPQECRPVVFFGLSVSRTCRVTNGLQLYFCFAPPFVLRHDTRQVNVTPLVKPRCLAVSAQ